MPDYSIIIPAFNEAEELPRTLAAVRKAISACTSATGECIVVDNNSTDKTAAVATEAGADQVIFEAFNQIACARNAGARTSRGKYLVFIDADTRIDASLLSQTIDLLKAGSCAGGGAIVRFEGTSNPIGNFGIRMWEYISKHTRTAAGSYLFCRRDAFEAVGGFDEKLFASEEIRLSRLLRKWARQRGMYFEILTDFPVFTSARKLQWYSGFQILGWALFVVFMPLAVRSRKFCGFWYERPNTQSKSRSEQKMKD